MKEKVEEQSKIIANFQNIHENQNKTLPINFSMLSKQENYLSKSKLNEKNSFNQSNEKTSSQIQNFSKGSFAQIVTSTSSTNSDPIARNTLDNAFITVGKNNKPIDNKKNSKGPIFGIKAKKENSIAGEITLIIFDVFVGGVNN